MVSDEKLDESVEREHLAERHLGGAGGDRAGGEVGGGGRRRRGGRERARPGDVRPDHHAEVQRGHLVLRRMRLHLQYSIYINQVHCIYFILLREYTPTVFTGLLCTSRILWKFEVL